MNSDVNETAFSRISSQAKRAKLERVSLDVEMDSDVNENTSRGRYSYMRNFGRMLCCETGGSFVLYRQTFNNDKICTTACWSIF